MRTQNWTQANAVTGLINGKAAAAGSLYSDAILSSLFDRLTALVSIGTLAAAGTLTARFQQCSASASSDTAWADISSASCITSAFASASNGSVGALELRLDQNPLSLNYVRVMTVVTSTWDGCVMVVGEPKYKPAKDVDSALVAQIVVY